MLIPLTRTTFEQLIPLVATFQQYSYHWKNVPNFLKQLLISFVGVVVVWLIGLAFGEAGRGLVLLLCLIAGLYWFWGPIFWASQKNGRYRRYPYSGFWRGKVLELFITEEVIGERQTVNQRGQLVIEENREKRLNLVLGDETGFEIELQASVNRLQKVIQPGNVAELIVLSNRPDLSSIVKITDAYLPRHNLWVGDYPYIRRDFFLAIREDLLEGYRASRKGRNF